MNAPEVEIIVYDAPTPTSGGCGCGCDHHHGEGQHHGHSHGLNLEYETRALALTLEKDFPGRVRVEYVNVLKDPQALQLPQAKLLLSLTYPSPLVYINGRGRFAGALPVERVRQEVAELLGAQPPGPPG